MIVDEANRDIEMQNDPFTEAGIDVPANLPYRHNVHQEQSSKKVLGQNSTPELTKTLRKINQWSLRGTGVSTAVLCKALESNNYYDNITEEKEDIQSRFRNSMRSNRRLSSPALYSSSPNLYSRQTNETWKGQEAEAIIKRKKFLKSSSALNVFHSSYIPGPETEVPASTRANLPTTKGRLGQNDKTDVSFVILLNT